MGLKEYFKQQNFGNINTKIQDDELIVDSRDTVKIIIENDKEVIPSIDYSDPSNFAKYGSAKEYYTSTIENIYQNYPYDGTKKEKQEFYNNLALYEKYIFDFEYPKSNGYINLTNNQYIEVKLSSNNTVDKREYNPSNLYFDNEKTHEKSPLALNRYGGNTIEFWFKEGVNASSYTLFELSGTTEQKLKLYVESGLLKATYASGSYGIFDQEIFNLSNITTTEWNHYFITFKKSSDDKTDVFVIINANNDNLNGKYVKNNGTTPSVSLGTAFTGSFSILGLNATIGSNIEPGSYTNGSIDEFKFWTKARDAKWNAETWFSPIEHNLETSDNGNHLGIYYKFNEGIVSSTKNTTEDQIVLDYSGHFANGKIINYNYSYNTKITSSALDESNFFDFNEKKDPIIFSNNPLIVDYLSTKQIQGSSYDQENSSQFFYLFPNWIRDEDETTNNELRNLTQIISSYLDKLYLQIENINSIKNIDYQTNNEKPLPFANYLLESKGLFAPQLFIDSSIYEEVFARNEERTYEETLNNVKNLIYKNIYNNLTYIYKSKGTEKSIRNLFRTFGIDQELLKLNIYSNSSEIKLNDPNKSFSTSKKNLLDFSYVASHTGSVYQICNTDTPFSSNTYNRLKYLPNTFECQIVFPNVDIQKSLFTWKLESLTSSLFGVHSVDSLSANSLSWAEDDKYNFQVYTIRESTTSKRCKFVLKSTGFNSNFTLTSSYYDDVYNNNIWSFAVRIKPQIDDYSYYENGTEDVSNYILEFSGMQNNGDIIENQFNLSQSINSSAAQSASLQDKRFYLGAHKQDYTGEVLDKSDIKIINARYWLNYLTDETLKQHTYNFNLDSSNNSTKKAFFGLKKSLDENDINDLNTLVFNWDFSNIINNQVLDVKRTTKQISPISSITNATYNGIIHGAGIDNDYINIVKNLLPEQVSTSDTINIRKEDDVLYTKQSRPLETFISIENSMYQIISEEMMNMFSSVSDFSNLIANPLNFYKNDYREMKFLRSIFFEKIENTPSFEKYYSLFKWIDSSIGDILKQIIPASANISDKISMVIESHILERNKYERKLSRFKYTKDSILYDQDNLFCIIKSLTEFAYNWKIGRRPLPTDNKSLFILWFKERAEFSYPEVTSGNSIVDTARQNLRNQILNINKDTSYNLYDLKTNSGYTIDAYFIRSGTANYKITLDLNGVKLKQNQKKDQVIASK